MQHNNTRRLIQQRARCENCEIQQQIESIIVIMVALLRQIIPLSCSASSKTVNTDYPVHQMASIHVHDTPSVRFAYTYIRCKHSPSKPPGEPSAQIKTPSNVMQHSPASHRYRFYCTSSDGPEWTINNTSLRNHTNTSRTAEITRCSGWHKV